MDTWLSTGGEDEELCLGMQPCSLKVSLVSWAEWALQTKFSIKALLLSHKMKKGHPSFLNSSSERSLGAVGSNLASDFVNGICLKDYTGVIELLYNFVPQD